MEARVGGEPVRDRRMLVSSVIVADQMQLKSRIAFGQRFQEGDEFDVGMALEAPSMDLAKWAATASSCPERAIVCAATPAARVAENYTRSVAHNAAPPSAPHMTAAEKEHALTEFMRRDASSEPPWAPMGRRLGLAQRRADHRLLLGPGDGFLHSRIYISVFQEFRNHFRFLVTFGLCAGNLIGKGEVAGSHLAMVAPRRLPL
jgi:hypothetical protein